MNRWLLVLGAAVLVLVVGLYWQMSRSDSPTPSVTTKGATTDPPAMTSSKPVKGSKPIAGDSEVEPAGDGSGTAEVADVVEGDAGLPKWEPTSHEFMHKIDVVVGDKFRAFGAKNCDESGLDPDGIVRITYKLRIKDSEVTATNIVAVGERGAEKLARCIEDSMQNASFRLPRMPDFEEDDSDLFIRVKTLRKYRSRVEFDE